jgi:hypothetical protein
MFDADRVLDKSLGFNDLASSICEFLDLDLTPAWDDSKSRPHSFRDSMTTMQCPGELTALYNPPTNV